MNGQLVECIAGENARKVLELVQDLKREVVSLRQEVADLRRQNLELRQEVGYWKSRHADAVKRIEQLQEELDQSRGQTRVLQDKLFGRKSEKSSRSDRSNDLFDPEEVTTAAKKRGAQPGHAGHGRRDYSHLPVKEEFVPLPEEALACPHCGKLAAMMSATEDWELLEIEVRAHRRRIRRRRYSAGQQRFGTRGPRPGRGTEKLLRIGFLVERPFGGDDVFALGDAGPLETQSASVADVGLGKLRGSRRESSRRYRAVLAPESLG